MLFLLFMIKVNTTWAWQLPLDILECTLYCVITQINVNSDHIFMLFSLFMIKVNTTWAWQLPPGHHTSIQHCVLLAHTCILSDYICKSECNMA